MSTGRNRLRGRTSLLGAAGALGCMLLVGCSAAPPLTMSGFFEGNTAKSSGPAVAQMMLHIDCELEAAVNAGHDNPQTNSPGTETNHLFSEKQKLPFDPEALSDSTRGALNGLQLQLNNAILQRLSNVLR
jgi:hypothetical protein